MTQLWDGMFLRGSLGSSATVPRISTPSLSPDILPYGTEPIEDPSMLTDEDFFSSEAGSGDIYLNAFNYLYMRAKNEHNGPNKGHFELYYAQSNLLLFPSEWHQLSTSDDQKEVKFEVKGQGEIAANESAYTWLVQRPDKGHYCLIGIVVDEQHGSPVVMTDRITDWTRVLVENGNIAQRNTNLITTNSPDIVGTLPYNQGTEAATVDIVAVCQNFPRGSNFKLAGGTPVPGYGNISITEPNTQQFNFKKGAVDVPMPANFVTALNWTLKLGSDWGDITGVPTVTVRAELVQGGLDKLYKYGRDAGLDPITNQPRIDSRSGEPVKVVTAGTFTWIMTGVSNPNRRTRTVSSTIRVTKPTDDTRSSALKITGANGLTKSSFSVTSGIASNQSKDSSVAAYVIEEIVDPTQSFKYPQINLSSQAASGDEPNVAVPLEYNQTESFEEVNLDIEWKNVDVSGGTYIGMSSPDYADFQINKRKVTVSQGKFGVLSFDTVPFSAAMQFQLWLDNPGAVTTSPTFTITVSHPVLSADEAGTGGLRTSAERRDPTKLVVLGKAVVSL